jgi:hypothetical protein
MGCLKKFFVKADGGKPLKRNSDDPECVLILTAELNRLQHLTAFGQKRPPRGKWLASLRAAVTGEKEAMDTLLATS